MKKTLTDHYKYIKNKQQQCALGFLDTNIYKKNYECQIQAFAEAGYFPLGIHAMVWYVMMSHHGNNDQRYFSVVTAVPQENLL